VSGAGRDDPNRDDRRRHDCRPAHAMSVNPAPQTRDRAHRPEHRQLGNRRGAAVSRASLDMGAANSGRERPGAAPSNGTLMARAPMISSPVRAWAMAR
jgi:hypothetical protein